MNAPAPLNAIIEWDVATWSQAIPLWERHLPQDLSGLSALEAGGRHGGLSLYLAQRGAQVVCSDLTEPGPQARHTHQQAGLAERIAYQAADLTQLPFADASFQLVAFKSVLGALKTAGRQQMAIQELFRVLAPGGWLIFAENLPASPLHMLVRRAFLPWGHYWRYVSRLEMQSWCQGFQELHLESAGVLAAFGRSEAQRAFLAQWDRWCPFPASWHYALFGAARK